MGEALRNTPRLAACVGKVRFSSPQVAWGAVTRKKKRREHREPYRCEHCGLWHLGWMPRPGKWFDDEE